MRIRSILVIALMGVSQSALAEEMLEADGLITVTATRDAGYQVKSTGTATRTDTPLLDVPQAINVLTRQRLDDQALLSVQDALRYVPGAVGAQGEGNRDQIVLRGNNSTADFFVDGVRDDVQVFRDFYNIERLEILKGSNAMTFGRGGGGGVVNRVTKTPGDTAFYAGDASVDTWGGWRMGGDINQPLGGGVTARLNAFTETGFNHRDTYRLDRWAVNPTLAFALGTRGTLVLGYEHARDDRTADRGVPSVAGRPVTGFRDTFFGDAVINNSLYNVDALTLAANYDLGENVTIRHRTRFADYDKTYSNVFVVSAVNAASQVAIEAYRDDIQRQNLFSQTDIVWKVSTGSIDHVVLGGVEFGRQTSDTQRINGFFDPVINTARINVGLADPFVTPPVFFRSGLGSGARDNRGRADIAAGFIQDQINIGDHVQILAGLRYDRFTLTVDNRLTATRFARTDNLWSPRLGLVLKPASSASIYASYSRSYLPQSGDQFTNLDPTLAALEPERFENIEIGAKWDITPALNASIAVYQLTRDNTRAPGPVAGQTVLTGTQRSRGIELSLDGKITDHWQVQGGLALQEARIRTTTVNAPAGRHVPLVPEFQASLWNRYDVSDRLGAGIGIVHQGKSFAGISNSVVKPAYTRLDGALFVRLTENLDAQVNVENIFNTGYFPTAHTDNNISTGGPRAARFTVRARF
ncbi:TonB-dependent siderophore receptor [Sandarakinorhabdus sp.]|uniref:TonB-dependent receptor n=1 Tax=Sandarakinorhabdus sp. TaxID=1916663 RepID=UPI00286E1065|nr:TonB-dependent siderophore receptor [Sandarakinorhabdus sp.]